MAVTTFQDLPLADRGREWDGGAAEKRVRAWAEADEGPNERYRDAHVWYDAEKKDIDRVRSHLAKYYEKMGDRAPWDD